MSARVLSAVLVVLAALAAARASQLSKPQCEFARVGHAAPPFSLDAVLNKKFTTVKSDDYKGKYLVLFFYPLDFTFVCPTEIIGFSDRYSDFEKVNAEIIGVSTDSTHSHLAWIEKPRKEGGLGDIRYPLGADRTMEVAKKYGVLIEEKGITLRGLFIIDEKGIVRHLSVNDDAVGRNVDEVLRLIKAFQFADKNGSVCPMNWKPDDGRPALIPDPRDSKAYFSRVYHDEA